ncbi:unnamed protein product [Caenorhabditis angaria]|uniref:C2 domain-containing protein n=1 Tax=Caenorhabditis angaria TaxID=860376 RepID=A0A9P1I605_9PELO|nr:unnamed protein product [Caenorhabditis angaria]
MEVFKIKIRSLPHTPPSSTPSPSMHHPQQRAISTYPALLEPTSCRRRLPMAPDTTHLRRSSSPRILPTPPPLSPEYRCPSAAPHLERRPSGRQLPRPPTAELNNLQNMMPTATTPIMNSSQSSLSPVSLTPDPTPDEPEQYEEEEEEVEEQQDDFDQQNEEIIEEEDDIVEEIETSQPEPEVILIPPPQPRRMSKFSVHSPSIEQISRKASNSDNDDPIAHGLDPSLYSPGAAIIKENNNEPIIHKSSIASTSSPILQRPTGLGLLHCSLQHFPVRKRLRVSILKIEALAGELKPEMEIHAICKVSIPGLKGGKEQTSEMKRGRDPVYNQEFFFDNVSHEELDTKTVVVVACHQGSGKIMKDIIIGEANVPLRDIREMNTKKEIKIVEEIKALVPKKLGKIYTTSIIEKDSKRLTINLKKTPDVCVKITLNQANKTQTKSSRILKSTTTAVYNESIMFLFGTAKNELAGTSITISVHDMQRSCTGDDIIGCAYLGVGAVDKSESEQWKGTIEHFGKEYKGNHQLKAPRSAPPVHVAEANDDVTTDPLDFE